MPLLTVLYNGFKLRKKKAVKRFVFGTAGHVDHGKTSLVKALTGVDTDRLPEEKARGLSIELGFAPYKIDSNRMVGIVDVPGHERFIRTMIAGASGMDALLLVVDAKEGVQNQTREHLENCSLLGIRHALCVLTKVDLLDSTELDLRKMELTEFLRKTPYSNASFYSVSARTGRGIDELRRGMDDLTKQLSKPSGEGILALPIDRVFTMSGHGTVVTGTLSGATLRKGDHLILAPSKNLVSVRSIQVFGQTEDEVAPGTRVALNLSGVPKEGILKGQTLVRPGEVQASRRCAARLNWLPLPPAQMSRRIRSGLRLFSGTQEIPVKVEFKQTSPLPIFAYVHSKMEMVFRRGDRFLLRSASPALTLAGGSVLDPMPNSLSKQTGTLDALEGSDEDIALHVIERSLGGVAVKTLIPRLSVPFKRVEEILNKLRDDFKVSKVAQDRWVATSHIEQARKNIRRCLENVADIPMADLISDRAIYANSVVTKFALDQLLRSEEHESRDGRVGKTAKQVSFHPCVQQIVQSGFSPPTLHELAQSFPESESELKIELAKAAKEGKVVRLTDQLYMDGREIRKILPKVSKHFTTNTELTIGQWKEMVGVSRKFAVPILEHLDRERFTLCKPDRKRIAGPNLLKSQGR